MLNLPTISQMPAAMPVTYAFSHAMKSHTSVLYGTLDPLPGQAKSCSAFAITRSTVSAYSSTVTSELLCATAGHSCCSASVMLDSRALQLRFDLETSPLSLLRRMPNQVAWKRHLRVNQRLVSVLRSSASVVSTGCSAAGSGALTASVVAWLICPGCLPDQGPHRQSVATTG